MDPKPRTVVRTDSGLREERQKDGETGTILTLKGRLLLRASHKGQIGQVKSRIVSGISIGSGGPALPHRLRRR